MQHVLLLVVALAGSDWNCTETNGLWDCRPARSVAKAPVGTAVPAGAATPTAAGTASLPAAPATGPIEAPAVVPDEAPAAVPEDAPAAVPDEAPAAIPEEAPAVVPDEAPAAVPNKAPIAAPGEQPAEIETPDSGSEQPTPGAKPEKAFIVQVGAYRQRADAEQAAARLDYESLAIVPTERDGESWWVIVLGAFRTLESANTVGAEYQAETGGSYWVRTSEDLQEVLAAPR